MRFSILNKDYDKFDLVLDFIIQINVITKGFNINMVTIRLDIIRLILR